MDRKLSELLKKIHTDNQSELSALPAECKTNRLLIRNYTILILILWRFQAALYNRIHRSLLPFK